MARASDTAADALIPGDFTHPASNIHYRILSREGEPVITYLRNTTGDALSGQQRLLLSIGSNQQGRTYLYQQQGLWFELPINFYTRKNRWDMAPAYDNATRLPAPLPVDPNCLHCHATLVQPSLPDARNHFADLPFRQGGIGCRACHGDPTQHLATNGHAPILNPASLAPAARDSICLQCHLEGNAVVYRPGRSLASFQPGQTLDDTAVYFVRASTQASGTRAVSQYEALLRSACKRAAGDALTCTSCHDPHATPAPAQRVAFYRARCLACHTAPAMATHHPEQPDCAGCHMPSRATTDISHEQVTDHDIEARPNSALASQFNSLGERDTLVPVGNATAGDREFGLAWAQLAQTGDRSAARQALTLLRRAAPAYPNDPELQARLGFLEQLSSNTSAAVTAYRAALAADPYQPVALADLAVLDAAAGDPATAIQLLDRLVSADPAQTSAGLNLAFLECRLNRPADAAALLDRLARFNPDDPGLRQFRATGTYRGQHCTLPH
jgi:predicted CXXCH cytochrome family protein